MSTPMHLVRRYAAVFGLGLAMTPMAVAQTTERPQRQEPPGKSAPSEPKRAAPGDAAPGKAPDGRNRQQAQRPKEQPGIAVLQPRTPAEREKALSDLYAHLTTASDENAAKIVAASIERLWATSGSDTVGLLMHRAAEATQAKKPDLALKFLDRVVALAPDYTEGWHRRAVVYYSQGEFQRAIGDLRRVLALDSSHFKALEGLGHMLRELGEKRGALQAFRRLQDIHPFVEGLDIQLRELARDVEGQSL
jgi:tetratricopeptide (TPR) repeat protein